MEYVTNMSSACLSDSLPKDFGADSLLDQAVGQAFRLEGVDKICEVCRIDMLGDM